LTRVLTPEQVRKWAVYAETSPLYTRLSEVIASNPGLMRVLNRIEHTPEPNILLAGVQFIMLRDGGGALGAHYPSLTDAETGVEGVEALFESFVQAHEEELVEIGRTRYTQTNECRRCAALLPAIWSTGADRFHLIDVGTSAGLNLLLDRYAYRWGDVTWGGPSPVELVTVSRGTAVSPRPIEVSSRTGIDLHPIDPDDEDDRRWLEALIWPEHHERRGRLRAALEVAAGVRLDLIRGDALDTLAQALDALPPGEAAVVMHSFVLNQLHPDARPRLDKIIEAARDRRPIHRVSMEALDGADAAALLAVDSGDGVVEVGRAQPHGEWLELYVRP
jgi:hypothetical protein